MGSWGLLAAQALADTDAKPKPCPEKSSFRNVWSAAELQAKTKNGSWSALMYSALLKSKTSGHDGSPLAFVPINWTVWSGPFPEAGFESVGSTHCHLVSHQQTWKEYLL
jgi:hypothetical protein